MAAFTHSTEVIGFNGKRFKIHTGYSLQGKEAVKVDQAPKATDLNQWTRVTEVEVV